MMTFTIQFIGGSADAAIAEAWCRTNIYEGYYRHALDEGRYIFAFLDPFEAQRFREVCHDHTKPMVVGRAFKNTI
jgi:hypothetical protein